VQRTPPRTAPPVSRRPWPDDAQPTAEQLIEWCQTGQAADVVPYLTRLLTDTAAMARVRALRDRWIETSLYGNWSTHRDYQHRVVQLNAALDTPKPQGDTP
jgi:hypothetical protein